MAVHAQDIQRKNNAGSISLNDPALEILRIQPEIDKFLHDCNCENEQHKLRSISCPETRKFAKLSPIDDAGAKKSESLIIYRLYETAQQKKINGFKKFTNSSSNQTKKSRKLAIARQGPNQDRQSPTVSFDDIKLINKLNKNFSGDKNSAIEASNFAVATLDQSSVNRQCNSALDEYLENSTFDVANAEETAETSVANSIKLCNALTPDYKTDNQAAKVAKGMINSPLHTQYGDNVEIPAEIIGVSPQSKRRSKRLEVDGVFYIVTMGKCFQFYLL